ncbi:YqhV family protein [Calderihabitans maritimus]|uniref:DUF2619 domain-containing protein n=1 Tax=Calderihabitans maritimus TaxID=1246530 RepID=A0A1Z5HVX0_9FIRM|nr:YqhV family protein [Calderihabitans maritimus]GAW93693.1 hypothetical protein TherJR_1479 [Calderihabitans maritimus]
MIFVKDKFVLAMAAVRIISGIIELSAAFIMLKLNNVEQAFKVNAGLALVGPAVFMTVTGIGLLGLAGKIPVFRMLIIFCGVVLIFLALKRS